MVCFGYIIVNIVRKGDNKRNNNNNNNVIKKQAEKILKYKNLTIQINRLWNVRNNSDTGNNRGNWNRLISFIQYLSNIPGKHDIKVLQKTATLGIAHILRRVLMYTYKTYVYIQGVPGGKDLTSGECSLGQTIPI